MKKLLICLSSLVIFATGIVLIQPLIQEIDLKILFKALGNFILFVAEILLLYSVFAYIIYRMASERKIRKDIDVLPIPVRVMRLSSLPGFRFPYQCYDTECEGVLVSTIVCEPHSLAEEDGKVFFPSSSNWCRISIGLLAQYRQVLSREDRLFCTDCGTEYDWRVIRPKDHPLNLYKIVPQ